MRQCEIGWNTKVEEGVCHTVWETAIDEDWYTKQHRKILAFACKCDNGCHYETTSNGEDSTFDWA